MRHASRPILDVKHIIYLSKFIDMPSIPEAIDALRVALHEKAVEGHVQDVFNHAASCLVLLNSSSPSVQMMLKLRAVLRQPLLPLYNACLQPALQLSSSVLSTVLGKLCDAQNSEEEILCASWDATAEVILSGILDFLDQKDGGNVESEAWKVLCRIVCEFFFDSGRGSPVFSVPLCLSAYNMLTETAVRQVTIQNFLRHKAGLGGERLGAAISRTRGSDYLPLEALLMLFARLLPPTHNTPQGKLKRIEFVEEVLGSPRLFKCSQELLHIMRNTSGMHWDDIAAQIIDALSRSDITYPQPFSIDEIDVCGHVFPQPLATDRLIMDKQAFLANIIIENNDLCESLQVPYSQIRTITLDNSGKIIPKGKVLIIVYLMSPPLVANTEMKPLDGSDLYAKFLLQDNVVGRFMEALRRRGVGKLSFLSPLTKAQRKRKSISIGSGFQFTNDSSPIPPTATFEGKVQHVSQVYMTDVEESMTSEAAPMHDVGGMRYRPSLNLKSGPKGDNRFPEAHASEVAEDVSAVKSAKFMIPRETLKPVQNPTLPFSPVRGNSDRAIQLPGDNDELSEISEFEPDNETINERAATTIGNHELRQTRRMTHHMLTNKNSSAIGIKKSLVSEIGSRTGEVTPKASKTGRSMLTSNSPVFGSSSSTQINISPKPLPNVDPPVTTASTDVVQGPFARSQEFVSMDGQKRSVSECRPSDSELPSALAEMPQTWVCSAKNESGGDKHFVLSSGAKQKVRSRIDITKDTNTPRKIAGNRRKRETVMFSDKVIIEVDDEYTPPRKKSRGGRLGTQEAKVKVNEALSVHRVKRCAKTAKLSSPTGVDSPTNDVDELSEFKTSRQGTRKSSRIRMRQTAATGGTRVRVKHGRKGKQVDTQTICVSVDHQNLPADSPQDINAKISHGTPPTLHTLPIPTLSSEFPSLNTNGYAPLVEPKITERTSPPRLPREMSKASTILPHEVNQSSDTPAKRPRENLDFVQQTMNSVEEERPTKTEGNVNDQNLLSDLSAVDDDISQAYDAVGKSEGPLELSRPAMESPPRTKIITIDLTVDDSPVQEKDEPHEGTVSPVRSATAQRKDKPFDQCEFVSAEEHTFVWSPQDRRRSVTFASPLEYVLDNKVKSKTYISPSKSPSPPENNILSPLKIPTKSKGNQYPYAATVTKSMTRVKASVRNQISDEDEIQDIVDVLNEIHAVIIKGVSDRFKNIKKDIQHGRDELIRQVLDELQDMVIENAKYFNGLVRLEEDYYKCGKAITSCWEDLIDCNDGIAVQFQNTSKEHDKNTSARRFPKSLIPLQPVFICRRANA